MNFCNKFPILVTVLELRIDQGIDVKDDPLAFHSISDTSLENREVLRCSDDVDVNMELMVSSLILVVKSQYSTNSR